jgi:tRNA pseudouridine55 synthase
MGRRKGGVPIHGWLIIDKVAGPTSAAVVGQARRLYNPARIGHAGTLDPLATGVLPLALGEATKTIPWVMDGTKKYDFTVRWGEARTTDDSDGRVTARSDARPDDAAIRLVLADFTGDIIQTPPVFSAIKIEGRRAYDLARAGEAVELKPRQAHVEALELVGRPDPDHACFRVSSGKGVYMRSLARDMALKLGTFGHVSAIRRRACGPFGEDQAISLERLRAIGHSAPPARWLLPVLTALADIPALALTETEAGSLRHGQAIAVLPVARRLGLSKLDPGAVYCTTQGEQLVALTKMEGGEIRPFRVFNF